MSTKKLKYEKPVALDMGAVSPVHGLDCTSGQSAGSGCTTGYVATGDCPVGNNPNVAPVCFPGNVADYSCSNGGTNSKGNCEIGSAARGCFDGSAP